MYLYYWVRKTYWYRYARRGYRDSCPSQTTQKTLKKKKNYNHTPGSLANHQRSSFSSPVTTAVEEDERPRELKKSHRTSAFVGVEIEEALGGRASTGTAPQRLQLDLGSPLTTAVATGNTSQNQPATIRNTHNTPRILDEKGQEQHHLKDDAAPARTPEQKLPNSPAAPE